MVGCEALAGHRAAIGVLKAEIDGETKDSRIYERRLSLLCAAVDAVKILESPHVSNSRGRLDPQMLREQVDVVVHSGLNHKSRKLLDELALVLVVGSQEGLKSCL